MTKSSNSALLIDKAAPAPVSDPAVVGKQENVCDLDKAACAEWLLHIHP